MQRLPVTVIIPAFGREQMLREALQSVAQQTRAPVETIVVDDGSPVSLAPVVAEFGCTYIRRSNGGGSAARNTGIAAASQPWIALLDSDDLWTPTKLERQFDAMEYHPQSEIVMSDYRFFGPHGEIEATGLSSHPGYCETRRTSLAPGIVLLEQPEAGYALAMGDYVQPSTVLFHRRLVHKAGTFDERLRWAEDYEFFLRLFAVGIPVAVEEPLVWYRSHAGGVSVNGVKMRRGDLLVGTMVCEAPERYPAGAARVFREKQPRTLIELAKGEILAGDYGPARATLIASLRRAPTLVPLALLALSLLAPLFPRRLRLALIRAWSERAWRRAPQWNAKDDTRSA